MMEVCSDLCCEVESVPDSSQLLKMNGSSLAKTVIRTKIIYYQTTHCKTTSRMKLRAVQYVDRQYLKWAPSIPQVLASSPITHFGKSVEFFSINYEFPNAV